MLRNPVRGQQFLLLSSYCIDNFDSLLFIVALVMHQYYRQKKQTHPS